MAFFQRTQITARTLRAVCILSLLSILPFSPISPWVDRAFAADAPTAAPATPVAPAAVPVPNKPEVKPSWMELTPLQQQVLGPLATQWSQLDANHKAKWIAISNKYPGMTPDQQKRLQENITQWAKLTPEQHRLARESYAKAKKLNPEQKNAQWQQYQQLPEDQKQKLAADAAAKKRIANVPSLQSKPKTVEPLNASKKTTPVVIPVSPVHPVPAGPQQPVAAPPASSSATVPQPGAPAAPAPNINK